MADVNDTIKNLNNTNDFTEEFEQEDIQNNKTMAILAYIGILVLIPIFAAKESKFARFHANQGLVLLIIMVANSVLWSIFSWIPVVKVIYAILGSIVYACTVALMVIGIINAAKGRAKELPVIGKIRILK